MNKQTKEFIDLYNDEHFPVLPKTYRTEAIVTAYQRIEADGKANFTQQLIDMHQQCEVLLQDRIRILQQPKTPQRTAMLDNLTKQYLLKMQILFLDTKHL